MKYIIALLLFVSVPAFADDGILLLGDSIRLIGYGPYVMAELPCVHQVPYNNGDSGRLLSELPAILAGKHYRIIHFNAGLWDIAHRSDLSLRKDRLYPVNLAPITTDEITYFSNMYAIIDELKDNGAIVIVATTTDVPQGSIGRDSADVPTYNNILETAALNRGIDIDDLYMKMLSYQDLHIGTENKVHYSDAGNKIMANHVVRVLKQHGGC